MTSKAKKAAIRSKIPASKAKLDHAKIIYRQLDALGEHYRVAEEYDWWPSTDRWRQMHGDRVGFGVDGLIKAIGVRLY